jgi:hypothetical protein
MLALKTIITKPWQQLMTLHKPYSILDILRMNEFWVEVNVKHQHFAI